MTSTMTRNQGTPMVERSPFSSSSSAAPHISERSLSRFLGYVSIGLGLAEALAPHVMARLTGVERHELLRAYGLREIVSGLGVLGNRRPAGWLWTRVVGDAMDLLTLSSGWGRADTFKRRRVLTSLLAVAGVTALDVLCAQCHSMRRKDG